MIVEANHGRRPDVTLRKGQQKERGVGVGRDLRDRIGPDPRWVRIWGLGGVLVFPN